MKKHLFGLKFRETVRCFYFCCDILIILKCFSENCSKCHFHCFDLATLYNLLKLYFIICLLNVERIYWPYKYIKVCFYQKQIHKYFVFVVILLLNRAHNNKGGNSCQLWKMRRYCIRSSQANKIKYSFLKDNAVLSLILIYTANDS